MAKLQSGTRIYGNATIDANVTTGNVVIAGSSSNGIIFVDGTTLITSAGVTSGQSFANGAFTAANSAASFANGAFTAANVAYGRIQITANTNGGLFANGTQGVTQTGNVLISVSNTHITNAVTANTTMGLQVASLGVGTAPTVGTVTIGSGANTIVLTPTTTSSAGGLALNMAGNAVFSISKTVSSPSTSNRIDLSVGGLANILSGPRWNGLHITMPDPIVSNAINGFPRAFTFWEYDATTNPTYLNFNILTGNSGGASGGANSNMLLGTLEAGYTSILTSGTERIRITSTGGVSFGSSTTAYGTSGQILTSNGNAPPTWNVVGLQANTSGGLIANGVNATTVTGTALLSLATSGVSGATYSNANTMHVVTFDTFGRATYAANVPISITSAQVSGLPVNTFITANTSDLLANGVNTPVGGNVLIGLATTAVAAGTYGGTSSIPVFTVDTKGRLTYAANVASPAVTITDDTSTNATRYPLYAAATSGTLSTAYTSSTDLNFNPSTGTLSAVIFTSLSDEAQKTNIKPIQNALNIVENIKGVTFDWKENNLPSAGLLAQDVEKYLPQLVELIEDKKTLNYNGVIGILVEAIKELNDRVKQLENKE